MALGAKIKKKLRKFFYDPLYNLKSFPEKFATVVVCISTKNDAKMICFEPEVNIDVRIAWKHLESQIFDISAARATLISSSK